MAIMKYIATIGLGLALAPAASAFESTKVLPEGVRNVDLRSVNTNLDSKTDGSGKPQPLAQPLMKDLTFEKMLSSETELKQNLVRAFLHNNDFTGDMAVGSFTADLKGNLAVVAPVIGYGLTPDVTIAVAVPYYRANTSVKVGFKASATGQAFLDALARPENNNTAGAREAGLKLNDAVGRLNAKLRDHGFHELNEWEATGLGDITIAAKARVFEAGPVALATTGGVVAPTGRTDDPDILTDIAFGDGQWDIFGQLAADQELPFGFGLNQYAKYTAQLPSDKTVRAATKDESIEVGKTRTRFKLGDKVDGGASLQYAALLGPVAGVGATYFRKVGDVYRGVDPDVKAKLEDETDQEAVNTEFKVGYSTLALYQAKRFAIPFEISATYLKQVASRHMPVTDIAQFDLNLFF